MSREFKQSECCNWTMSMMVAGNGDTMFKCKKCGKHYEEDGKEFEQSEGEEQKEPPEEAPAKDTPEATTE